MQHTIGKDYSEIIKKRKNRKDFPPVVRLNFDIDLEKLQEAVFSIQTKKIDNQSTETEYRLNKLNGEKFVNGYENFIHNYSKITFHKMTKEATILASKLPNVSNYGPRERLKGMTDTSSKYYHPSYDERNYTVNTEYVTGYIKEVLEMFKSQPCRAAVVVLEKGQTLSRHVDIGPEYVVRCHIPLQTNNEARIGFKIGDHWEEYHLPADGGIYAINAGLEHYAFNLGPTRTQIRICLTDQQDLVNCTPLKPVNILNQHFCQSYFEKFEL